MNVLMFGWEFPPHISGGLGTACYGLTKALSGQGTNILLVIPKVHGDEENNSIRLLGANQIGYSHEEKYEEQEEVKKLKKELTYIPIDSPISPYMTEQIYDELWFSEENSEILNTEIKKTVSGKKFEFSGKYGANLMEEVRRYAQVAKKIALENDFDIIHAHDWLTFQAGIEAKKISNKPLIIHVHATEFDRSGEHINPEVFRIEKLGMEMADRIIAVSEFTKNILINRYEIPADKIIAIHNGVDFGKETDIKQNSNRLRGKKIVTFLGRITYQKGPTYFVDAAYRILQKNKEVVFVMAGNGDLLPGMIEKVAALGISSNFFFTGFLKGKEVSKRLGMSDVYVMPSVSEPFGISPLEAMKSGVPVIISRQSGVSEVVEHALKVDFWDVEALADAIFGLLNYNTLSHEFSNQGRTEVDKLNWEKAAEKTRCEYEILLNQNL